MSKSIDNVKQSSGSDPSAEDLFEAIHAAMHLYRSRQYQAQRSSAHDLTHMDGKVLAFFARHPGATQKDLAEHSGRDKGQLGRLVAGLREHGLLDARPDEADRRNIRIEVTPQGRAVHQTLQRQARRVAELAVANLGSEERRRLAALLRKVQDSLANED
jgi:DNA-binding MarR family transcriptional regulator